MYELTFMLLLSKKILKLQINTADTIKIHCKVFIKILFMYSSSTYILLLHCKGDAQHCNIIDTCMCCLY